MATKSRIYGCRVPPGGTKKGCGGGAKVIDLEKRVRKLEAEIEEKKAREARHEANRRALEKAGAAEHKRRTKKR